MLYMQIFFIIFVSIEKAGRRNTVCCEQLKIQIKIFNFFIFLLISAEGRLPNPFSMTKFIIKVFVSFPIAVKCVKYYEINQEGYILCISVLAL